MDYINKIFKESSFILLLSYIAGFFDGGGNLHINKILNKDKKVKAYQLAVRFYNSDVIVLSTIKTFLGIVQFMVIREKTKQRLSMSYPLLLKKM